MKKLLFAFLVALFLVPVVAFSAGQAGAQLTFDGVNDGVIVPDNALLDNLAGNYTIEAWLNSNAYANYDRILDRSGVFALTLGPNNTIQFARPSAPPLTSPDNTVTLAGTMWPCACRLSV